jgi:hypothetical protein
MNTTEYREMLAVHKHFEALLDDAYKAMTAAETDFTVSLEEMDALYDRCDKALDAKHGIDDALEAMRKVQELKAALAQMELQAQQLTNRAQALATAYFEG